MCYHTPACLSSSKQEKVLDSGVHFVDRAHRGRKLGVADGAPLISGFEEEPHGAGQLALGVYSTTCGRWCRSSVPVHLLTFFSEHSCTGRRFRNSEVILFATARRVPYFVCPVFIIKLPPTGRGNRMIPTISKNYLSVGARVLKSIILVRIGISRSAVRSPSSGSQGVVLECH